MSLKLSLRDGFWYVDVRLTPAAHYKPYSRHPSLNEAMEQMRLVALTNGVEI